MLDQIARRIATEGWSETTELTPAELMERFMDVVRRYRDGDVIDISGCQSRLLAELGSAGDGMSSLAV